MVKPASAPKMMRAISGAGRHQRTHRIRQSPIRRPVSTVARKLSLQFAPIHQHLSTSVNFKHDVDPMFCLTNYQVKADIHRNNIASQDKLMTIQPCTAHQFIHNSPLKRPTINTNIAMPRACHRPRRPPARTLFHDIPTHVRSLDRFLRTLADCWTSSEGQEYFFFSRTYQSALKVCPLRDMICLCSSMCNQGPSDSVYV